MWAKTGGHRPPPPPVPLYILHSQSLTVLFLCMHLNWRWTKWHSQGEFLAHYLQGIMVNSESEEFNDVKLCLPHVVDFKPLPLSIPRIFKMTPPRLRIFQMFQRPHLFSIILFSNMLVFQLLITELFYCLVFGERPQYSFRKITF